MKLTKRNHYNPCFWIALWNSDYYNEMIKNIPHVLALRDHSVYSLNIKSGQIHNTKVNKVHYDKNLGVAEITKEAAENFVKKYHPNHYESFLSPNENAEYPVYIDFEDILTAIEKMPPYKILLTVAKKNQIDTIEEKAFLGCFIILQQMRSHAIMNAMLQFYTSNRENKFEHFITLKWMLSDTNFLFSIVNPLVDCQWTLYSVKANIFPLCDSAILVKPHSVMVAISPRLLLEIKRTTPSGDNECRIKRKINKTKYNEFMRRTIGNTFREIIGDEKVLKEWKDTMEFKERIKLMKNLKNYNRIVQTEGNKELWHINAYGNKG